MLEPGDAAPEFSLPAQDGRSVTLNDLLDVGDLLLFFYPRDFTPVCTREVCLFRDAYAELAATGIRVAGISPDDADAHARFSSKYDLGYTLLADPEKRVIREFGVDGPLGIGVRRVTVLIDRSGVIQHVIRADLRLTPHSELIQMALAQARSNARRPG